MVRRDVRSETLLATARITGRRWSIAMREAEWERFVAEVGVDARLRLAALMGRFCDRGGRDLPVSAFRWLTRPGEEPREAAFESRGFVLRGHAANRVLFIDALEVDPDATAPPRRGRRRLDPDQHQLPLPLLPPTETSHRRDH